MKIFGSMQRPQRSDLRLVLVYWLLAAPIIFYTYQREYGAGRGLLGKEGIQGQKQQKEPHTVSFAQGCRMAQQSVFQSA